MTAKGMVRRQTRRLKEVLPAAFMLSAVSFAAEAAHEVADEPAIDKPLVAHWTFGGRVMRVYLDGREIGSLYRRGLDALVKRSSRLAADLGTFYHEADSFAETLTCSRKDVVKNDVRFTRELATLVAARLNARFPEQDPGEHVLGQPERVARFAQGRPKHPGQPPGHVYRMRPPQLVCRLGRNHRPGPRVQLPRRVDQGHGRRRVAGVGQWADQSGEHYDVRVDPISLRRLIAWVDTMCPYQGDEEVRQIPDRVFQSVDWLAVRPKIQTAPRIIRPGPVD